MKAALVESDREFLVFNAIDLIDALGEDGDLVSILNDLIELYRTHRCDKKNPTTRTLELLDGKTVEAKVALGEQLTVEEIDQAIEQLGRVRRALTTGATSSVEIRSK